MDTSLAFTVVCMVAKRDKATKLWSYNPREPAVNLFAPLGFGV